MDLKITHGESSKSECLGKDFLKSWSRSTGFQLYRIQRIGCDLIYESGAVNLFGLQDSVAA